MQNMQQYYSYRPPELPKKRRSGKILAIVLVTLLTIGLVGKILGLAPGKGSENDGVSSVEAAVAKPIDEASMHSSVTQVIAQHPDLQIGVSIIDLQNGHAYNYGVNDASFIGASTTKVLTAALYLRQVEQGKASLSEVIDGSTATTLLRKMIVESDNAAWNSLNTMLGREALQAYAAELGMLHYDYTNNSLTTPDMALLLQKLYNGNLVNDNHTQLLLGYMQQADITDYIVDAVGAQATVYHKAGYLEDRVLDAAIIDNGKHPYVLVIFSKADDSYDQTEEVQLFGDITKATLSTFSE